MSTSALTSDLLFMFGQITSEVHLFSHTKGVGHQQAVRDGSSIQGRELSDEEVVGTGCLPPSLHPPFLPSILPSLPSFLPSFPSPFFLPAPPSFFLKLSQHRAYETY